MKEMVESMVQWQRERCLDPGALEPSPSKVKPQTDANDLLCATQSLIRHQNIQELQLEDAVRVKVYKGYN